MQKWDMWVEDEFSLLGISWYISVFYSFLTRGFRGVCVARPRCSAVSLTAGPSRILWKCEMRSQDVTGLHRTTTGLQLHSVFHVFFSHFLPVSWLLYLPFYWNSTYSTPCTSHKTRWISCSSWPEKGQDVGRWTQKGRCLRCPGICQIIQINTDH